MQGTRLGNVTLGEVLGQGGMGTVYAGHHETLDIDVAVKVLHKEVASNEKLVTALLKEARAAAKVNHPNAIRVYDCGEQDGTYYLIMERVDGTSCGSMIAKRGRLPVDEAARYIADVARALGEVSMHGVVHCDVKPGNILVTEDGTAKITDLGIARVLQDAEVVSKTGKRVAGTPAFMAPEQGKKGGEVDHRTDIYGLGATFYMLISGKPLFEGDNNEEILRKQVKEAHRPVSEVAPDTPEEVCKIVERMIEKKKEDRYQDATELLKDLQPLLGSEIQSLDDLGKWLSSAIKCYTRNFLDFTKAGACIALGSLVMYGIAWGVLGTESVLGELLILIPVACFAGPMTAGLLWTAVTALRDPLYKPNIKHLFWGFRWFFKAALAVLVCEGVSAGAIWLFGTEALLFASGIVGALAKACLFFALCAALSGAPLFALPFKALGLAKDYYQAALIVGVVGWLFYYVVTRYVHPSAYVLSWIVGLPLCCCLVARFCTVESAPREQDAAPPEAQADEGEADAGEDGEEESEKEE